MLQFNQREQLIISKLVKYNFSKLNTLGKFLEDEILTPDSGLATICFKSQAKNMMYINTNVYNTDEKLREGLFIISEIFLLLLKLRDNGLIICLEGDDSPEVQAIGIPKGTLKNGDEKRIIYMADGDYIRNGDLHWFNKFDSLKFKAFGIDEKSIPIRKLIGSLPFISQELVSLTNRNFISEEETRFKKELFWTKLSFALAFVGLIIAIINPFIFDSKLNNEQFLQLTKYLNKTNELIDINNSDNTLLINTIDSIATVIPRIPSQE
ncbi:MAG: hypothetical protein IJN66_07645 [Muribaculaceae bacterium]|nr:hypothetical protein [Muribaculaceae bacterium]